MFLTKTTDDVGKKIKSKKNNLAVRLFNYATRPLMKGYYSVKYENVEELKKHKGTGFVMLPKHNAELDAIVEFNFLQKAAKRNGNYMMKASLPKCFQYFGGLGIVRKQELQQMAKKDGKTNKEDLVKLVKQHRDAVYEKVGDLVDDGEIVVIHPEGTVNYQKPGKLNRQCLDRLIGQQERIGKKIPFVPLEIEYSGIKKFRSKIIVKVGKTIYMDERDAEKFAEKLKEEIKLVY